MCGRFSLSQDFKKILRQFGIDEEPFSVWKPRYNIAPSDQIPVIFQDEEKIKAGFFKWGLIPHWAKDQKIGYKMINARAETLVEKPSFKSCFKNKRCLIPADGFYEWKVEAHKKQPYYIHMKDNSPFFFAGLWSLWLDSKGNDIHSCTIITGLPNKLIEMLHNRMPVILPTSVCEAWLNPANHNLKDLQKYLKPYPEKDMEIHPVSTIVNSPRNDLPACRKPQTTE